MLRENLVRLRLAPDTRERHAVAALLLGGASDILDVGGTQGTLAAFVSGRVTTANTEPPADVVLRDTTLPFAEGSFDAVTSLDVLEHLTPAARLGHLVELGRVARRLVVLSTPLGTPKHVNSERELARWYIETTGAPHRFLQEHFERGLVDIDELARLADEAGLMAELRFHGDYRIVEDAFRTGTLVRKRRRPADLARYARLRARRADLGLLTQPAPTTNRVFLIGYPRAG